MKKSEMTVTEMRRLSAKLRAIANRLDPQGRKKLSPRQAYKKAIGSKVP